jgi:hypothetical protein
MRRVIDRTGPEFAVITGVYVLRWRKLPDKSSRWESGRCVLFKLGKQRMFSEPQY